MSHFLIYALHYVILRTLYDGALRAGISPVLLVACAVGGLVLLAILHRAVPGRRYGRRSVSPSQAYKVERARVRARRDAERETDA
jgi:hypothetical protein